MSLIVTAILLILLLWCLNRWKNSTYVNLANQVPSNKWHTFLGWGKIFNHKDLLSYLAEYGKKYGENCVFWMGPVPFFMSTEPQTVKEILTSKNCIDKPPFIYHGMSFVLGEGLISENDELWTTHRKLLNKAFSYKVLLSLLPVFYKNVNNVIEEMQINLEKGEMVDMLDIFRKLTLKNASQTVLKRNLDLSSYNVVSMSTHLEGTMVYIIQACLNQIMRISLVNKMVENCLFKNSRECTKQIEKFVAESMDILQRDDTTDPSYLPEVNGVLDFALDGAQNNIMNMTEVRGEMMHLFAAAFDTTSYTLFLVVVLLAMHPECQERVYEEVLSVAADDDTEMTVEQLDQLVYLEMVFDETLRLFPAGPVVARKVSNHSVTFSNGLSLPIGQHLCIDIYSMHRRKDIWGPDANLFNPENFLPSNVATRHPYSFVPFTKGLRYCIGMKYAYFLSKISLAKIIKRYKFTTDFKYEDLVAENHTTLKLTKHPPLYVERRTPKLKINV